MRSRKKAKEKEGGGDAEIRSSDKSTYKSFKVPLKSVLREGTEEGLLQDVFEALVLEMNDLMIHTYQLIRLYLVTLFAKNSPFPTLDADFVNYCTRVLGSVKGNRRSKCAIMESLQSFYTTEYKPLVSHELTDLGGKTQLRRYMSTQIITCISNNVQEHFQEHLKRFVNLTLVGVEKKAMYTLKHQLLSFDLSSSSSKDSKEQDVINSWKATHLSHLIPNNVEKSVYYDLKKEPTKFLRGMMYMNKVLEASGHKLFQPIPLRTSLIPKHIILDTQCITELFLSNIKTPNFPSSTELSKNVCRYKGLIWSALLNLDNSVFRNKYYCFNHQIQTDGISCSLLFIRKDQTDHKRGMEATVVNQDFKYVNELSMSQLDSMKDRNVVGCDPGKMSMVYMVDENGNKLQYTAHQRRVESYGKRNNRILNQMRKHDKIQPEEAALGRLIQIGVCNG
jgi:hypothetical protein